MKGSSTPKKLTYLALPAVLAFGLIAAVGLEYYPQFFFKSADLISYESLHTIHDLNRKYDMHIQLLEDGDRSVMASLLSTNSFLRVPDKNSRGLIASLDHPYGDDDVYVLIQPAQNLDDETLEQIAHEYETGVEAFNAVEVDQPLSFSGDPVFDLDVEVLPDDIDIQLSAEAVVRQDVTVALIDSGLDRTHPIFAHTELLPLVNTVNQVEADEVGHGTHVGGIIARQVDQLRLAPYKIVGAEGGKLSNVIKALDDLKDSQLDVDVLNLSFGIKRDSEILEEIMEEFYENDVVVVAAAGNENNSLEFYPAYYSKSFAVSAVNQRGEKLSSASYGTWVDAAANGYLIRSSVPNGRYGYKSGTSQATAYVTGRFARFLSTWNPEDGSNYTALEAFLEDREEVDNGPLAGTFLIE